MRLLQPLPILEKKWEVITIDFITKLQRKTRQNDSIMVVVDKLTKVAHFIPVNTTHKTTNIEDIYMKEVARIHGVPKVIISNKYPNFTSTFWEGLFKGLEGNLNLSISYHPESDGKT